MWHTVLIRIQNSSLSSTFIVPLQFGQMFSRSLYLKLVHLLICKLHVDELNVSVIGLDDGAKGLNGGMLGLDGDAPPPEVPILIKVGYKAIKEGLGGALKAVDSGPATSFDMMGIVFDVS